MPSPTRSLMLGDVRRHVRERVLTPGDTGRVGIELEWIATGAGGSTPTPSELRAALPQSLPHGGTVTFEPGGQFEVSSPPRPGIAAAVTTMRDDLAAARAALAAHGIALTGIGLDPRGPRARLVDTPRYLAMERYFDSHWPEGRTMMRSTAAIQVNLDVGADDADVALRWQRAHHLGPVLAAAFANSPFTVDGRVTGWRSNRLAVWAAIDPCRTDVAYCAGVDPVTAWTDYVLAAPLMMVRVSDTRSVAVEGVVPFARWVERGGAYGWPTVDDLEQHLTTLFPPVRPRGWLELRMIDALPDEWWPVAVTVTAALMDDPDAAAAATEATEWLGDGDIWKVAARDALSAPPLRKAADRCFRAALDALSRLRPDAATADAMSAFYDRFVARGRCPADDRIDEQAALATTVA